MWCVQFKKWIQVGVYSLVLGLMSCVSSEQVREVALVPTPVSVEKGEGYFSFTPSTVIAVSDERQLEVANVFASLFSHSAGFTPKVKRGDKGDIQFVVDTLMKDEAYDMEIQTENITVKAAGERGFFYALQTLRLLLPPAIESKEKNKLSWSVPVQVIKDEPRFSYRGFMLDVSRYFLPKDELLRMIDCIAMLKINRLHLHLTDDNGWRLEIKKYPKLTDVGAWRVDRQHLPFPERRNPQKGEPTVIGGFYTQEDMKEIIRYAAVRQVEVIPEIDVPAHSNAALASYPELACPVVDKFIGVLPGMGGRNSDIIFCAGNEKTFEFLEGVLDEVMELFPSHYIHLGGDEASKTYWKKCPLCQKRIHQEHLDNEEMLQGYFMSRLAKYVRSKGREVMGWDELTNSFLPEDAIVFGWRGLGNAALKAADQGHRFIMSPARISYLIRYQGPQWFEPFTYFGNNTLKNIFDYEPVQAGWKPEYESLLMGVEGCLWTEFCNKPDDVFYLTFPRLAALAEVAWGQKGRRNWTQFLKGLDNYVAHLEVEGVNYASSMFNIQHKITVQKGRILKVSLDCERTDVEIRYTLDNTEPTGASLLYTEPLLIDRNVIIKAATFVGGKQKGETLILPVCWNRATACPVISNDGDTAQNVLVNGLRGSLKYTDFEWYTGNTEKMLKVTVDLLETETIRKCTIGCITNYGMAVHKPSKMTVEISLDGIHFTEVGQLVFSDEDIFKEGNFIEDLSVELDPVMARYVRFTLFSPGKCPETHVRPGQPSRVYVDEIIIE